MLMYTKLIVIKLVFIKLVFTNLCLSSQILDALILPLIAAAAASAVAHWLLCIAVGERGGNRGFPENMVFRTTRRNEVHNVWAFLASKSSPGKEHPGLGVCTNVPSSCAGSGFNSPHWVGSLAGVPHGMSKTIQLPVNPTPLVLIARLKGR